MFLKKETSFAKIPLRCHVRWNICLSVPADNGSAITVYHQPKTTSPKPQSKQPVDPPHNLKEQLRLS